MHHVDSPGDLEAMAWQHRTSTQLGPAIGMAGRLFTALVSSLYCVWLLIEGCYQLRRHSAANRAARIHEMAWNAVGVLITTAAIGAVIISR
jgi:dolichyl-phosphate-mannose--protein O-mannosyl transferase